MISPTGVLEMRGQDRWGHGGYGRPRGNRVHKGIDFIVKPEFSLYILFPFEEGKIIRCANPYVGDKRYGGCLFEATEDGHDYLCKMFYFALDLDFIQTYVGKGTNIGVAQDLTLRYPDIIPHVHLEVQNVVDGKPNTYTNPIALLDKPKEAH